MLCLRRDPFTFCLQSVAGAARVVDAAAAQKNFLPHDGEGDALTDHGAAPLFFALLLVPSASPAAVLHAPAPRPSGL